MGENSSPARASTVMETAGAGTVRKVRASMRASGALPCRPIDGQSS